MDKEHWEELVVQVEDHGPEKVVFMLETDNGAGSIDVIDVKFEDNTIWVVCV